MEFPNSPRKVFGKPRDSSAYDVGGNKMMHRFSEALESNPHTQHIETRAPRVVHPMHWRKP